MPNRPRYAVIDIGSNSVRMIVYERGRSAMPLFNEKASCSLGKNLGKTGILNPDGVVEAHLLLERFANLSKQMKVKNITVVATAAVRSARNGAKFVKDARKKSGLNIRIISGKEEAKLSALGVVSAFSEAAGIVGDMGGGSMELVGVASGRIKKRISLQHGPLNLADLGLKPEKLDKKIAADFANHKWLKKAGQKKTFYAVGGVFRAMARLHMDMRGYPLHVVHNYTVPRADFVRFLKQCRSSSRWKKRAEEIGIAKNRIAAIPYAAAVLLQLFDAANFGEICFSTYGLREGIAYDHDRRFMRERDLLLATCEGLARRNNRFELNGDEVFEFLGPIAGKLSADKQRLFRAACWMSDIGWADHPEERAKQIFHRLLHGPLLAVTHADRVFIAACCYSRYAGKKDRLPNDVAKLCNAADLNLAMQLGTGLRFADTLCGGAPGILSQLDFSVRRGRMELHVPKKMAVAGGEEVPKRFEALADTLNLRSLIVQKGRSTR